MNTKEITGGDFLIKTLPGTTYPLPEKMDQTAFSLLHPAFAMTGGLTLSQVRELTGLEGSTVQNWVKRGWVQSPEEKKYKEIHLARILIINILRGSLKLERIADLMRYVNGETNDRNDDIIPDCELYDRLCAIILKMDARANFSDSIIWELIEEELSGYTGPFEDSRERLTTALYIMVSACISSLFRQKAETLLDNNI